MDAYMENNLRLWEEWTRIHVDSEFYDVASFRDGTRRNRLRQYEIDEVGDVTGKDLMHLQCHFGMDTLSWAKLGATVTGVDFSTEAITQARKLAAETGIEATFIESNVYDALDHIDDRYDIVYTSRGVLGWLPDLVPWARVVAGLLRAGGIFYITEIHPIAQVLDDTKPEPTLKYPYWTTGAMAFDTIGSYADRTAHGETKVEYGWNHSLGEIVTALAEAGLRIESLREYPFVEEPQEYLEESENGTWRLPGDKDGTLPLFFSLKASKDR